MRSAKRLFTLSVLSLLAWFATRGRPQAIKPAGLFTQDSKRFAQNRFAPRHRRDPSQRSLAALSAYNGLQGGGWKATFHPRTGALRSLTGGAARPRRGRPEEIAAAHLRETREMTEIDPAGLSLRKQVSHQGISHLLYTQTYKGLPVEFGRVKVHIGADGSVLGLDSTFEPALDFDIRPGLTSEQAFESVRREIPGSGRAAGSLVIFPDEQTGDARLAWRFSVAKSFNKWRYYVDAHTGQVLYRYDDLRHQAACVTSGVVSAMIYDIDPDSTPAAGRYFAHQRVYVQDGSLANSALTDTQGFFCSSAKGKIATSLQGPFVNVSNFTGPNAHYDNGDGVWATINTPASSPHPYPADTVLISTISLAGTAADLAVKFLPVFTNFHVGTWTIDPFGGEGGDIGVDDQVAVLDSSGNAVGSYLGDRGDFNGAAVHGKILNLRLKATADGHKNTGFDVVVSSYLTLNDPTNWAVSGSSVLWTPLKTANNMRSEINLFYHINRMHDYFMSDVDLSSAAYIGDPVNAIAFVGPTFDGAFFSPEDGNLNFGDFSSVAVSDLLTDDATVPHHEYTHFVVDKIWPILNFGQAGAVSEANADYWAASSLNNSSIGRYYQKIRNAPNAAPPLRELDCRDAPNHPPCSVLSNGAWQGEIHSDSIYLSQAMWDVRRSRIQSLGNTNNIGVVCADRLMFGALFWFPESFEEFYNALLRTDKFGVDRSDDLLRYGKSCGGTAAAQAAISTAFSAHGMVASAGDAYAPNGGFETAVDISTIPTVTATIFPAAEEDFYSFAAGPGTVRLTLNLPPDSPSLYKAYMLTLFDRNHVPLKAAEPAYDGRDTIGGAGCAISDCTTTQSAVTLTLSTTSANYYFVRVSGGATLGDPLTTGSQSGVNSTVPYVLQLEYSRVAAFPGAVINTNFDQDIITFTTPVTRFLAGQNLSFAYARLRDQSGNVLVNTIAAPPATAAALLPGWGGVDSLLVFISSQSSGGAVSGQVQLSNTGSFASRYPAVGTIYLEVFAYDILGSTKTLGLSQAINLNAGSPNFAAWNNVLNPLTGGKTTIKYEILQAGRVLVQLFSLNGNLVKTLVDDVFQPGKGSVDWAGQNNSGATVASGVYLLHIRGPGINKTKKIVVVK